MASAPASIGGSLANETLRAPAKTVSGIRQLRPEFAPVAQTAHQRELEVAATSFEMVGDTGLEPVTPSV